MNSHEAAEQGVEADEAWSTSELRSLTPVFYGQRLSEGADSLEKGCRGALVLAMLAVSWLGMMAVHEVGHVLHAYASGGRVSRVVLDPGDLSRTELFINPAPLFVAWGGVVWGSALPTVLLAFVRGAGPEVRHLVAFFVGFCFVANGAYLLAGLGSGAGDAGDLMRLGASTVSVLVAGVLALSLGLTLWHRLGPKCGFLVHRPPLLYSTTPLLLGLLVVSIGVEVLLFRR